MEEKQRPGMIKHVQRLLTQASKYKYALLVALLGTALMLWPGQKEAAAAPQTAASAENAQDDLRAMEASLAALLSKVDGAGPVEVMLSLEYGQEFFYQADEQRDTNDSGTSFESQTVFSQDGSKKLPVATKTRSPVYKGAVIVCGGADRPSVKLAIVEAVSRLTGLGSDKISVIKMKGH